MLRAVQLITREVERCVTVPDRLLVGMDAERNARVDSGYRSGMSVQSALVMGGIGSLSIPLCVRIFNLSAPGFVQMSLEP